MEVDRIVEADLTPGDEIQFKPVKAILWGLAISVVLLAIASTVLALVFGISIGIDWSKPEAFESLVHNNIVYLIVDILLTFLVLFLAGIVVAKNTSGRENKFVVIVSLLTLAIYIVVFNMSETGTPVWYDSVIFLSIPLGIYLGSEYKKRRNK